MLNVSAIQRQEIGVSHFTDFHNNTRKVYHSRLSTDEEKLELERRISEEIFQVFARKRK